jgi:DNA ligase-1
MPGNRDFAWIKLKKNYLQGQFDSFDLVIIGYFLGKGKYANKPSSLLCAIYDEDKNVYKAVAKVASGLTEEQIDFFSEQFKELDLNEKPNNYLSALEPYKYIQAKLIVEVVADEITLSPLYKDTKEGFSLRFPRFIKIQDDRASDETTTEDELKRLFDLQKH